MNNILNRIGKMEKSIEQVTESSEDPALIKAIRILIEEGRCGKAMNTTIKEQYFLCILKTN